MSLYNECEPVAVAFELFGKKRYLEFYSHIDNTDQELIELAKEKVAKIYGGRLPIGIKNWYIYYRGCLLPTKLSWS